MSKSKSYLYISNENIGEDFHKTTLDGVEYYSISVNQVRALRGKTFNEVARHPDLLYENIENKVSLFAAIKNSCFDSNFDVYSMKEFESVRHWHRHRMTFNRDYDPELNNALEDKAFTASSEDTGKVEYRVKKREVHFITRYVEIGKSSSVNQMGEFSDPNMAYEVAYAMAKLEHQKLGWQPGDERIVYPERPEGCKVDIPGVISHSN